MRWRRRRGSDRCSAACTTIPTATSEPASSTLSHTSNATTSHCRYSIRSSTRSAIRSRIRSGAMSRKDRSGEAEGSCAGDVSVPHLLEVLAQDVSSEVAVEIPPDRVNVVAVVLGVVVLDQERRALHAVIVLLALLGLAEPGKPHLVQPGTLDLADALGRDVAFHVRGVGLDQLHEERLLL